ncbi:MAG: dCTP deaminase [Deltaproteobacteria bacterium]|jgi:dCTP deaminase|nr:MAG: dCTP deaminase [Deltaproteobacteria bacterium]
MSILTREEILKEIERGNIKIDPFSENHLGPASLDLHLSNEFRVFKKMRRVIEIKDETSYEDVTEKITVDNHLVLMPGEMVLGITVEKITLSPGICGWLEGRSRFARLGLLVHISTSFIQPGISNKQCLEIINFSPMPLALFPGTSICQFIFQRTVGEARYSGRFKDQDEYSF